MAEEELIAPAPPIDQKEEAENGELPEFYIETRPKVVKLPDLSERDTINVRYPLMPPYAFCHIYWDEKNSELLYDVEETPLNDVEKELLKLVQLGLEEMINISYVQAAKSNLIIKYLEKNVQSILLEIGAKISKKSYMKIMYYIYRDFVGLNEVEPLLNDVFIEDIECNGSSSPIYVVHRKYQNIRTNVIFNDVKKLTDFVEKLAQKTGRYVSFAKPLLDGSLPDGSRVNATYTSDVTTHGPTFTIRKFTKEPLTPMNLMDYNTATPEIFAYLWIAIENKFNIMVIGETASGKTTFLNSILQFVPVEARIVSIEDTRELNLAHENWIPSVARTGFGIPNLVGKQYGEITLFDLLRETFRQNPDYVIVGEVRGKETYVLFQGMASIPGDQKIMILQDNKPTLIEIGKIKSVENCKTIAYNPKTCEARILPLAAHIRHPERKELVKITTKTGREIVTTPDHSLFAVAGGQLIDVAASSLEKGSGIAIAARIPCGYADISRLNLIDLIPNIRIYAPELVKEASHTIGYYPASQICAVASITDYYSNFKKAKPASMKKEIFFSLMKEAGIQVNPEAVKVKLLRKSRPVPSTLEISNEFLKLLGYYISEGTVNFSCRNNSFALYNKREEILKDMERCIIHVTGNRPSTRKTNGYGSCDELKIGNKIFAELLNSLCARTTTKHIPEFIFGLSKERIGQFLSALYTGDGYVTANGFGYTTISKELAVQLQQLLLVYGIVATLRTGRTKLNREIYSVIFYRQEDKDEFFKYVTVLGRKAFERKTGMTFTRKVKDVYLDKVKKIETIQLENPVPVYDLSVPGYENFISQSGIILHNSGHSSFSTFHAASVETLIRRLVTPPINLPASLVNSLDIICSVIHIKDQKRNLRRVKDIREMIEVKQQVGEVDANTVFQWNPETDKIEYKEGSVILKSLSKKIGTPIKQLEEELKTRAELISKMKDKGIMDYTEFSQIVHRYYKNPEAVLKEFGITRQQK